MKYFLVCIYFDIDCNLFGGKLFLDRNHLDIEIIHLSTDKSTGKNTMLSNLFSMTVPNTELKEQHFCHLSF